MSSGLRYLARLVLVLLIVGGTLSSQAASLEPSHTHQGVPTHCCSVCHAGHLPLVEAPRSFGFLPPTRLDWFVSSEESADQRDPLIVLGHSRAPPSLVVL